MLGRIGENGVVLPPHVVPHPASETLIDRNAIERMDFIGDLLCLTEGFGVARALGVPLLSAADGEEAQSDEQDGEGDPADDGEARPEPGEPGSEP